jgi:hypothetical protein
MAPFPSSPLSGWRGSCHCVHDDDGASHNQHGSVPSNCFWRGRQTLETKLAHERLPKEKAPRRADDEQQVLPMNWRLSVPPVSAQGRSTIRPLQTRQEAEGRLLRCGRLLGYP